MLKKDKTPKTPKTPKTISSFLKPKTKNFFFEGIRLAFLNFLFILGGGGAGFAILRGSDYIRSLGFPMPLPFWFVFLPLGGFYYITWFRFGKDYGRHVRKRRFVNGLIVGLIGQVPGFGLAYYLMQLIQSDLLIPQIVRIGLTIVMTLNIVLPLMVALGTMDQKIKGATK